MITKIEVDTHYDDVTFYFGQNQIGWSVRESNHRSWTKRKLRKIEKAIIKYNKRFK